MTCGSNHQVPLRKVRVPHSIMTHYLPLYFPEAGFSTQGAETFAENSGARRSRKIVSEQEFQFEALVSEGSAIRLGRLLGGDTILLYRTDGATLIDRFLAYYYHAVPPFVIMSKMMNVESAEMIFHNVVTSLVNDSAPRYWRCLLSSLAPHH